MAKIIFTIVALVLVLGFLVQWNQKRQEYALEDCIQKGLAALNKREKEAEKAIAGPYFSHRDPCDPQVQSTWFGASELCNMRRYGMERKCLGKGAWEP